MTPVHSAVARFDGAARRRPVEPAQGALFGRDSVYWRLNSRWSVLAGGPAAVLLQVAHPSVGAGVANHSSYKTDPFGRLERTLDSMLTISFGTPERREETLATLRTMHRRVAGTRADGQAYRAADPELQLWVWATLGWVGLEVERKYVGRLSADERARFYDESKEVARAFRVPERLIPETLGDFHRYVDEVVAGLEVTDDARDVAETVVRPKLPHAPGSLVVPLEWITTDLLPASLRSGFGLAELSPVQRRVLRELRRVGRLVLPNLPAPLAVNPLAARAVA